MRRRFACAVVSALALGCGDDTERGSTAPPSDEALAEEGVGPRQLRLLTRREYNATIADLFGAPQTPSAPSCSADAECAILEESCVGGGCQKDACELVTFLLEGHASATTVVVAGSFNGWAATEQAGGYAMTFDPALGAWVTKRAIADGAHLYKLVVDGSTWLADPMNPATEDDGFGGLNSVLDQSCAGEPPPSDPPAPSGAEYAKDFPTESRPEGYPFDNAASALVTSTHVEQYLRAGERIATERASGLLEQFGCEAEAATDPCVRDVVEGFGRLAFRRPLDTDEAARLHALVTAQPDLATGLRVFVQVALSSPAFLYRSEIGVDAGDGTAKLTPYEIATALSYTLVGSTPSAALLDAAEAGALDTPEGVEAKARDLLEDPRAEDMMGAFAEQWLAIETLEQATKNGELYPEFDAALASEMKAETRALFTRVALGGAPFEDLFLASTTTATGDLASLYGADAAGALPAGRHAGLLAQASVLSAHAHSDQTSPVRRGVFVRTRLLCQPLAPPPPNAGGVPEVDPSATTRERFNQHSSDPTCNGCHKNIDPIGFGFEGFDAIGKARDTDAGKPVDVSGVVTSVEGFGTDTDRSFVGLPELGAILAESESAKACLVTQLYRRASGVLETPEDDGTIASLTERFSGSGHDVRELLVALTQVKAFSYRRAAE